MSTLLLVSHSDVEAFTSVTGASVATARRFIRGSYARFRTLDDSIAYFFEVGEDGGPDMSSDELEDRPILSSPSVAAVLPPPELRSQLSDAGVAQLRRGLGGVALNALAEQALQGDRIRERFDVLRFVSRQACSIVLYEALAPRRRKYIVVVRRHRDWAAGNAGLLIDAHDERDADGGATRRSIALQHGRVAALHALLLPRAAESIPPLSELKALVASDSSAAHVACSACIHAAGALARILHSHLVVDDEGLVLKIGGGAADVARSGSGSAAVKYREALSQRSGVDRGVVGGEAPRFEVGDYVDDIPWSSAGVAGWEGVISAVRKNRAYDETDSFRQYTYACGTRESGTFDVNTNAWEADPLLGDETVVHVTEQARFLCDCTHDDGAMTIGVPETKLVRLSAIDCGARDRKIANLVIKLALEDGYRYTEVHVRAAARARPHDCD